MSFGELQWIVFNPPADDPQPRPEWMRMVCRDRRGRIYVSAGLGFEEEKVVQMATQAGIVMVLNEGHLYVPIDWLEERLADHQSVLNLNQLRENARSIFEKHYPASENPETVETAETDGGSDADDPDAQEVQWFIFDAHPLNPNVPQWMRTACQDEDGRFWAPAVLVDSLALSDHSEERIIEHVEKKDAPVLRHEGHIYVPLDWLIGEWPEIHGPKVMRAALEEVVAQLNGDQAPSFAPPVSNRLH